MYTLCCHNFFFVPEFYGFIEPSMFNIIAYQGDTVYIDCRANATLPLQSVTWKRNGIYLNQSRVVTIPDGVLIISNATDSDAGNYTCRLSFLHQFKERNFVVEIKTPQFGKFYEL